MTFAATKLPIVVHSALLLIIPNPFPNQKSIKSLLAVPETVFTGASVLFVHSSHSRQGRWSYHPRWRRMIAKRMETKRGRRLRKRKGLIRKCNGL